VVHKSYRELKIKREIMLKTQAQLEIAIGERLYQLNLPSDAPLGEAFDALFQMRTFIVQKINDANSIDKTKESEDQEKVE
jgi:hypothetical protein